MAVYKEKYGARRDTDNALRPSNSQITWTDVPWDEWTEIPQAKLWAAHPEFPLLVCVRRTRKGMGQPNDRGRYVKCEVTAFYELVGLDRRPPEEGAVDMLYMDFGIRASMIDGQYTYGSGGDKVQLSPSTDIPTISFTVEKVVSRLPVGQIMAALGKINSDHVRLEGGTAVPGHLLFGGLSSQRPLFGADGSRKYEIHYMLEYHPFGWNKMPQISGANVVWTELYPVPYQSINLSWLSV